MVFGPRASAIGPDAVLVVTVVPFTFMVAVASAALGVMVTDATVLGKLTV